MSSNRIGIFRPRRGKRSTAISKEIMLKKGEVYFEVPDTGVGTGAGKIVMGDGVTPYEDLPYYSEGGGGGGTYTASEVSYDNTDSGLEATNVQDAIDESLTISSHIVAVRETSPATAAHSAGDYIRYNGVTYKVKAAIAIGDDLVLNTNIETNDLPDMTNIYTPDPVGEPGGLETTSGNPISIVTDCEQAVNNCIITLEPIQAGSGDPSPSNVREISGYDEVTILTANGDDPTAQGYIKLTDISLDLPETVYGGTLNAETGELTVTYGIVDLGDLTWTSAESIQTGRFDLFHTSYLNKKIGETNILCSKYKTVNGTEMQTSDYCIRGSSVNRALVIVDTSFSGYTDSQVKDALYGTIVAYELSTPYTIKLSPYQVQLLEGNNVVSSNGTSIQLIYRDGIVASLSDISNIVSNSINSISTNTLYKSKQVLTQEEQTQVLSNIGAASIEKLDISLNTVNGNPLVINTDSEQVSKETIVTYNPIQSGTGDPSPSNIRPISGYNVAELIVTGKNLFNGIFNKAYIEQGITYKDNSSCRTAVVPVQGNTYYSISKNGGTRFIVSESSIYPTNNTSCTLLYDSGSGSSTGSCSVHTSNNAKYILAYVTNDNTDNIQVQIELGSTVTPYANYSLVTNYSESLPETIYGGKLNVETGELVVDRVYVSGNKVTWAQHPNNSNIFYTNAFRDDTYKNSTELSALGPENEDTVAVGLICNNYNKKTWNSLFTSSVDYGIAIAANGMLGIKNTGISSLTDWNNVISDIQIVYTIKYPYTIHLTPSQVNLLKNTNVVSSNGSSIKLTYRNGNIASLSDVYNIESKLDTSHVNIDGNPIIIEEDSKKLVVNTKVDLLPIQSGSGDPSPTNIRSISGYDSVYIFNGGHNIFDINSLEDGAIDSTTGQNQDIAGIKRTKGYIPVKSSTPYILSGANSVIRFFEYDNNKNYLSTTVISNGNTIITSSTTAYIRINAATANYGVEMQVEEGTTATPFNSTTNTLNLPETVYGGTLNVETGELVVDRACIDMGSLDWTKISSATFNSYSSYPYNIKSSLRLTDLICSIYKPLCHGEPYDETWTNTIYMTITNGLIVKSVTESTVEAFKSTVTGQKLVYELATPYTIKLTPNQVRLLAGKSIITTNGSTIHLTYSKSTNIANIDTVDSIQNSINVLSEKTGNGILIADNIKSNTVSGKISLYKVGPLKVLDINTIVFSTDVASGAYSVIGYVPSNLAPSRNISFAIKQVIGGVPNPAYIDILSSTKEIRFYNAASSSTAGYLNTCISYI